MGATGRRTAGRRAFALVVCLIGVVSYHSAWCGSLDKCDLARIAAHNAVLDQYAPVLETSQAKPLIQELARQEAMDVGQADREAASDCNNGSNLVGNVVAMARSIAERGIRTVMARDGISTELAKLK